ncbi:hypothetical protein E4U41_006514, partial [Claviceps citrina]
PGTAPARGHCARRPAQERARHPRRGDRLHRPRHRRRGAAHPETGAGRKYRHHDCAPPRGRAGRGLVSPARGGEGARVRAGGGGGNRPTMEEKGSKTECGRSELYEKNRDGCRI